MFYKHSWQEHREEKTNERVKRRRTGIGSEKRRDPRIQGGSKVPNKKWFKHSSTVLWRLCDFSAGRSLLIKHYNEIHEGTKHFKCDLCEYTTNLSKQLYIHTDVAHSGKVYNCDQCPFETAWPNYLKIHMKSIHLKTYISCSQCDFQHPWRIQVNKHERTVHGKRKNKFVKHILGKEKEKDPKVMKTEKNMKHEANICAHCGFTTTIKSYLLNHQCVLFEKFKCEKCPYKTTSNKRFEIHQAKGHDIKYRCDKCKYFSYEKVQFDYHVSRKHEEKKQDCDKCDYTTNRKQLLKYHHVKQHSEATCKECGKTEKNKYFLKLHIQRIHVGRNISCNRCDFSDTTLYRVEKHARIAHS